MKIELQRKNEAIDAVFELPGDKSIAHRALIIGALGKGSYKITNFPHSLDCLATLKCMEKVGVKAEVTDKGILVCSPGYESFNKSLGIINAENSGTTARLLFGLLAGCGIKCTIDGDSSLRRRPMDRVITPLKTMGAEITSDTGLLPISLEEGNKLKGMQYELPVDSAQVKSCILIAGFLSQGCTTVIEKKATRDHTEKMFQALGAKIEVKDKKITIEKSDIKTKDISVPGDISSAAFLIACALLGEGTKIKIENVLLNIRRRAYLDILKLMDANIEYKVTDIINGEEIGYITAESSHLKGISISEELIPNIIDEIPVLSVLAAFSEGKTIFNGVNELKHKESNRIKSIVENLKHVGISVKYNQNVIEITGSDCIINKEIYINPFNDHRIALSFTAIALRNLGRTIINNWECTNISFKDSLKYFKQLFNLSIYE